MEKYLILIILSTVWAGYSITAKLSEILKELKSAKKDGVKII